MREREMIGENTCIFIPFKFVRLRILRSILEKREERETFYYTSRLKYMSGGRNGGCIMIHV